MNFINWPKITNSYNTKFIDKFLEEYPELVNETYIITEKIHGCNLQLAFSPGVPMQAGSRTRWLDEGEFFFDAWNVLEKYKLFFQQFQFLVNTSNCTYRLFAELFGRGIQKEIQYTNEKMLYIFGMMVDDELSTFEILQKTLDSVTYGRANIIIPVVGIVETLEKALEFNVTFPTTLNPIEGNLCEGVVIQPYSRVYRNYLGQSFLLKKKNAKFMERAHVKKELKAEPDAVVRLNSLFKSYITENRLDTLFSKVGPIEADFQIGDYIRWMLDDAKKDFIEDYAEEISGLGPNQERKIYNVGAMIANMLKARLKNG